MIDFDDNDLIFHYTSLQKAVELIFTSNHLMFSGFTKTSDPDEYKRRVFSLVGYDDPPDLLLAYNDFTNEVNLNVLRSYFTICFCSNEPPTMIDSEYNEEIDRYAFTKGWAKPRMWEQYGNKHNGICFVCSKKKVEVQLKEFDESHFGKMKYRVFDGFRPESQMVATDRLLRDGPKSHAREFIRNHIDTVFFEKHLDYRDESEYRAMVFNEHKTNSFLELSEIAAGIIVGDQVPPVYNNILHNLCDRISIDARKVLHDNKGRVFVGDLPKL